VARRSISPECRSTSLPPIDLWMRDGHHTEKTRTADRKLITLAKTMNLEAIVKKTGRKPDAIIRTAKRLGLSVKGRKAKGVVAK
jgi:hypothetical protein